MMRMMVVGCSMLALVVAMVPVMKGDLQQAAFEEWRVAHAKVYDSFGEYHKRLDIFHANRIMVDEHNAKKLNYTLKLNHLADLTRVEFAAQYGLGKTIKRRSNALQVDLSNQMNVPDSADWTTKGVVTPVKNQGQCGSCWTFSTTGAIEGAWAIAHEQLVSLSEQQLVDCAGPEGGEGCGGGWMDWAFQYALDNKGLCTEKSYPYEAEDDTCRADQCSDVVSIKSFVDVRTSSEKALKAASSLQPVAVAIEADQMAFQFYDSGVFDGQCGLELDHAVLLVGYGEESGKKFWKIKNSWGGSWGEKGYIRIIREESDGKPGQCGIALKASYPIAA